MDSSTSEEGSDEVGVQKVPEMHTRTRKWKKHLDVSSKRKRKYSCELASEIDNVPKMRKRTARRDNEVFLKNQSAQMSSKGSQCNFFHNAMYSKYVQTAKVALQNRSCQSTNNGSEKKDASTNTTEEDVQHSTTDIKEVKSFLMDEANVDKLLNSFARKEDIIDFGNLLKGLVNGLFPADNIAWLCALDRARYASCKSTTLMKYRMETVEFWSIVYLLFGNSALSVFRGSTHFGKVVTEECRKGIYDPQSATCNFSVPSLPTLRKVDTGYARKFEPGFIEPTLKMGEERSAMGRQFTLALDGKKIGEGVKGLKEGDVDLMGFEKPRLQERLCMFNEEMKFAEDLLATEEISNEEFHIWKIRRGISKVSRVISKLQESITSKTIAQNNMKKANEGNRKSEKRYEYTIGLLNVRKHECELSLKRALSLNGRLLLLAAKMQGLQLCFSQTGFFTISRSPLAFTLLPVDFLENYFKLDMIERPLQVKQGSDLWFRMRKVARVTGSTMYHALGLEMFKKQKAHFNSYVTGLPSVLDEQTKKNFEYGKTNEVNAAATFIGQLSPAWFPVCCRFLQVGLVYMGPSQRLTMLEVSADGVIQCENEGNDCPYKHLHLAEGKVIVELKCRISMEELPHFPYPSFPVRYVTQCLAEMAAFNAEALLLLCWTPNSSAVFLVHFDSNLWQDLYDLTCELYGAENCKLPTKWHRKSKELMPRLKSFVSSHTKLMCVIPSLMGEEGNLIASEDMSCFAKSPDLVRMSTCEEDLIEETKSCAEELKDVFSRTYDCLREPASEVMLWMLSCKDRLQEKDVPNSAPLCYHMKGRRFNMETARNLVEKVRDKMKEREIDILCENYDGQFHPIIVRTIDGEPLTKIQVQKQVWSSVADKSKDFIIASMLATNNLSVADRDILLAMRSLPEGISKFTNLCIEKKQNPRRISVWTRGGPEFSKSVAEDFKFNAPSEEDAARFKADVVRRKEQCKVFGLKNDERNLLNAIHPELLEDIQTEFGVEDWNEMDEDELPDLNERGNPLSEVLSNDNFHLLEDLLQALREHNPKWKKKTVNDLFPDILQNATKLNKECTKTELQVMAKVLSTYTQNRAWFDSSKRKYYNVNLLATAFESTIVVTDQMKESRRHNPSSLLNLCKKKLMSTSYSSLSLKVSYAKVLHEEKYAQWQKKASIKMHWKIPYSTNEYIELFSYPEFSHRRKQVEYRSFDPVHILTKVRGHLIKTGYSYTSKQCFIDLCNLHPDILSKSIVIDGIDPQNAFVAERVISEKVELALRSMGHYGTGDFLRLFRNFFNSTNNRGISADERVCKMYDLYLFLLKNTSFDTYPPKHTQYVNGMPIKTFEAILQLISTRIPLYDAAKGKTYNVRACTTLPCESKFSDITRLDREGHLYPKACNMSKLIGRAVNVNYIKHKPCKAYEICTSTKGAYCSLS